MLRSRAESARPEHRQTRTTILIPVGKNASSRGSHGALPVNSRQAGNSGYVTTSKLVPWFNRQQKPSGNPALPRDRTEVEVYVGKTASPPRSPDMCAPCHRPAARSTDSMIRYDQFAHYIYIACVPCCRPAAGTTALSNIYIYYIYIYIVSYLRNFIN